MAIAYQILWSWEWQGIHFRRAVHSMKMVYDWYLWIGFFEIRKYHTIIEEDYTSGRVRWG